MERARAVLLCLMSFNDLFHAPSSMFTRCGHGGLITRRKSDSWKTVWTKWNNARIRRKSTWGSFSEPTSNFKNIFAGACPLNAIHRQFHFKCYRLAPRGFLFMDFNWLLLIFVWHKQGRLFCLHRLPWRQDFGNDGRISARRRSWWYLSSFSQQWFPLANEGY